MENRSGATFGSGIAGDLGENFEEQEVGGIAVFVPDTSVEPRLQIIHGLQKHSDVLGRVSSLTNKTPLGNGTAPRHGCQPARQNRIENPGIYP